MKTKKAIESVLLMSSLVLFITLTGCEEHLPPSAFEPRSTFDNTKSRKLDSISIEFSIPVSMSVSGRKYNPSLERYMYDDFNRTETSQFHIIMSAPNSFTSCAIDSTPSSIQFLCKVNHRSNSIYKTGDWTCTIAFDRVNKRIDSITLTDNPRIYIPNRSDPDLSEEIYETLHLGLQDIPYQMSGDTMIARVPISILNEKLYDFRFYSRNWERHFPGLPHYMNTTNKAINEILPANSRSTFEMKIW